MRNGKQKYLERVLAICQAFCNNEFLKQRDVVEITGIPKSAVGRVVNNLIKIGAITRVTFSVAGISKTRTFRYKVEPLFLELLEKVLSKLNTTPETDSKDASSNGNKSKNLGLDYIHNLLIDELSQEERDEWARNGFFRIHGFQRGWTLRNYTLIDDEDLWHNLATTLNPETVENPVRKVMLGKNKNLPSYIIIAPSETFKGVKYQLHFKKKKLIVSLPKESSIWIPWDNFREDLEQIIEQDIREVVEKAIKAYNMWFNQQVLAYDDGWVGKKKKLKPEVGYIDPDGIIRKVYEVEGATYIEDLGFWIDASLKPAPEGELKDIKTASNFKKAIDILASGELYERIEEVNDKLEELKKEIVNEMGGLVKEIVVGAVKTAMVAVTEKLVEMSYAGGVTIQQQFTELWKRIAEMQEILQLVVAVNLIKDDMEVSEELKKKLLQKLGVGLRSYV